MKTKITLKFIPSDFTETMYTNSKDCAITRALARAGFHNFADGGTLIYHIKSNETLVDWNNDSYEKLSTRVVCMYRSKIEFAGGLKLPIKKFQHTLIF